MLKVIELIRVSTEGQAALDRASIPAQRAINRKTAAAYGLNIVRSFEMADVSGAAVLYAPEMQQMLQAIRSPEIHGVVAREFSRLMRPENFADYALLQAFADTRTILYLPEGPLDFNSKTGRLMGTIRAAIAGMERSEIVERIWSAKEEMRRRGECPSGNITWPYGVAYEKGCGWCFTADAEKVREAFKRFLSGRQSYAELAELLGTTIRGVKTILANPIYTGWRVYDKRHDVTAPRRVKPDGRQMPKPEMRRAAEEVIRVRVIPPEQAIITEAEHQRVLQIMETKRLRNLHVRRKNEGHERFVYHGFLTCAKCSLPVYTSYSRADYYVCKGKRLACACDSTYMRRERLDETLDALFAERLTDTGLLSEMLSELEHRQAHNRAQAVRLREQMAGIRSKRRRVLDSYVEGVMGKAERDRRLEQIAATERATQQLLLQIAPYPDLDLGRLTELVQPFASWPYLTSSNKRMVLSATIPEIHVADYQVAGITLDAGAFVSSNSDIPSYTSTGIATPVIQRIYLPLAS